MTEQLNLSEQAGAEQAVPLTLRELLRKRFEAPEWAMLEEVAPATGGGTRYADAVAVNLWQSRGHAIYGFELKVSRSDWLRELKQPEKAEPVMRYCDHWWLVTEKGCVKDGELPINWGHMERAGAGLRVIKAAPRLEAQPVTRAFFASLMRRGLENLSAMASRQYNAERIEQRRVMNKTIEERVKDATRDADALKAAVKAFEDATGISINQYRSPIAMVALAQRLSKLQSYGSKDGALGRLTDLADLLSRASADLRGALDEAGLS